ncbi:hypothetical protein ZEAMMB73_Zm00001d045677 [Zea mays]|uniref:Uncharacterized protein n=1 Tax=Zea mays TaxID=4577 RepID=A0A1D6NY92_MAIZE|nr:hypothetical protein ZEAMMB73_Zm00001d045677 [Zea mays]
MKYRSELHLDLCSPNPRRHNTLALRRCRASRIAPRQRARTVVDMHAQSELISPSCLLYVIVVWSNYMWSMA